MAMTVRTNIAAIRSSNVLNKTQSGLSGSLERISSGLRINRAADDAAGLSVATRMESDNTSLKQAMRNANDGISMVQTAEGGLNEVYNILVRLRELSTQASNETYSSQDRSQMNTEYTNLVGEIKRIASISTFNRQQLLNQSTTQFTIQVGIQNNADNRLQVNLSTLNSTLGALGLTASFQTIALTRVASSAANLGMIDKALTSLNTRRSYLGSIQNRIENALNEASNYSENLSASASQIMDVDYAEESANMTRYQIMQQAGVAALGQAKAIPQSVVSLLS
jgi:flagellin